MGHRYQVEAWLAYLAAKEEEWDDCNSGRSIHILEPARANTVWLICY